MAEAYIKKRPKYLDVFRIRLPLPGRLSILHRASGVGLFIMLGPLLWLFQASVTSPDSFETFREVAASPFVKLILAGLTWAYLHHFCAGIRFLLLDLHIGIDLPAARLSAWIVFAVSLILTVVLWGTLLW
ncbi:MAG: succinate dehydrogenase, cytochrome b556 subunit [Zoogloeaceae bacterium]|jgi:succinate dehydrogenase / fumarate reductase cytochrome b subunit|nr:succinate dehydrogenase, cytochrome b556 subunit [Zoogloeaceae bacterium]